MILARTVHPKHRRLLLCLVIILLAVAAYFAWPTPVPALPAQLSTAVPAECRQLLLLLSPSTTSIQARLWRLRRESAAHSWQVDAGPLAATVGRKGLAWGLGLHSATAPEGFPIKQEGDKCSPAGVFALPFTFGIAPTALQLRMPYVPLTDTIIGVDDPASRYYNQVVDSALVERDWSSHEPMRRWGDLYQWGAMIGHNPQCQPGRGSCIFLHRWPAPGKATAGCTALSAEDLRDTIAWLDAEQKPHLLQGLSSW
jgi:L,D-peptidoglycan transpeptidase YkuD (ErfK/YbiS/YcfS/YnhG family)